MGELNDQIKADVTPKQITNMTEFLRAPVPTSTRIDSKPVVKEK